MAPMTERRSTDVNDSRNWALDCAFGGCGQRFAATMVVGDVAEHWNRHAGGYTGRVQRDEVEIAERDRPVLVLQWIGVGQPPKGRPSFLQ